MRIEFICQSIKANRSFVNRFFGFMHSNTKRTIKRSIQKINRENYAFKKYTFEQVYHGLRKTKDFYTS